MQDVQQHEKSVKFAIIHEKLEDDRWEGRHSQEIEAPYMYIVSVVDSCTHGSTHRCTAEES